MLSGWQEAEETWQRIRWARQNARFEKAKDAADTLKIEPNTYRSYERSQADAGRIPKIETLKRIATLYRVSWLWLHDGNGDPLTYGGDDAEVRPVRETLDQVPTDKRGDALNASLSVLRSYIKKAG